MKRKNIVSFKRYFLGVALLSSLTLSHAYAQINDSKAEDARQAIQSWVDEKKDLPIFSQLAQLQLDGDVMVEPMAGYFAVTMPQVVLRSHDNKERVNLGIVALNIAPAAGDVWRVSAALPEKIGFERDEEVVGLIEFGDQSITGTWSPSFMMPLNSRININDLRFAFVDENITSHVQKIESSYDVQLKGLQTFVTTETNIFDTTIKPHKGGEPVSVEKISFRQRYEDVDPKKLSEALSYSVNSMLGNIEMDFPPIHYGRSESIFNMTNFSIGTIGQDGFLMGQIQGRGAFELDKQKEYGSLDVVYSINGIELYDKGENVKSLPDSMNVDIKVSQIPIAAFYEAVAVMQGLARQVPQDGEELSPEMNQKMREDFTKSWTELWEAVKKSDLNLKINEIYVDSDDGFQVKMEGGFEFAPQSPLMVTGELNVALKGVQDATNKAMQNIEKIEDPEKKKAAAAMAMQATMGLSLLHSLAEVKQDEKGDDVLHIRVSLTPEGKFLINDKPFSLPGMPAGNAEPVGREGNFPPMPSEEQLQPRRGGNAMPVPGMQ